MAELSLSNLSGLPSSDLHRHSQAKRQDQHGPKSFEERPISGFRRRLVFPAPAAVRTCLYGFAFRIPAATAGARSLVLSGTQALPVILLAKGPTRPIQRLSVEGTTLPFTPLNRLFSWVLLRRKRRALNGVRPQHLLGK